MKNLELLAILITVFGILFAILFNMQVNLMNQINDVSKDTTKVLDRLTYQIQFQNTSPIPPSTVTPTPTYNPSKTSFVGITDPKDKGNVSWRYMVKGNSSATKESGLYVYVLSWPNESNGPWWVQPTTTFSDGSWQSYAYFGRDPASYPGDRGTTDKVIAIISTQELKGGQTFADIPNNVVKSSEIIVTRI